MKWRGVASRELESLGVGIRELRSKQEGEKVVLQSRPGRHEGAAFTPLGSLWPLPSEGANWRWALSTFTMFCKSQRSRNRWNQCEGSIGLMTSSLLSVQGSGSFEWSLWLINVPVNWRR